MLDIFVRKCCAVLEALAGVIFLTLFSLNILRIAMRYFAGAAWIWLPDFSRLLFIWVVFIGASILVARNEHLVMDFFVTKLSPAAARRLGTFIRLAELAFFGVMLVGGIRIVEVRMRIPFDTWEFPTGWAYLAVPVCAAFMILFSVNSMMQSRTTIKGR